MFISVITKNLNWEILTKNLDGIGLRMEIFSIIGIHWITQFLGGGGHEKPIYIGGVKKGELEQFADLKVA